MITFFNIHGAMVYVDEPGTTGYEDVFTKIEMCRRHYEGRGRWGWARPTWTSSCAT
jgi:2,4'-dihydroxyacetophenone dioxygenase